MLPGCSRGNRLWASAAGRLLFQAALLLFRQLLRTLLAKAFTLRKPGLFGRWQNSLQLHSSFGDLGIARAEAENGRGKEHQERNHPRPGEHGGRFQLKRSGRQKREHEGGCPTDESRQQAPHPRHVAYPPNRLAQAKSPQLTT